MCEGTRWWRWRRPGIRCRAHITSAGWGHRRDNVVVVVVWHHGAPALVHQARCCCRRRRLATRAGRQQRPRSAPSNTGRPTDRPTDHTWCDRPRARLAHRPAYNIKHTARRWLTIPQVRRKPGRITARDVLANKNLKWGNFDIKICHIFCRFCH